MKKIIAVVMAAMMISSFSLIANAESSSGTVYLCGDTDQSGEDTLHSNDLAFLRKVLLGVETANDMCNVNEDADGDVDILDLVRLKKMLTAQGNGVALQSGVNEITDNWN